MVASGDVCESHTVTDTLGRQQPRPPRPITKVCPVCAQEKPVEEFWENKAQYGRIHPARE